MASSIKSGAILHLGRNFVIDRLQTAGVESLNRNKTKIKELGNWESVATIYDPPELTFGMESLDVTTEIEALLCGKDPSATAPGTPFDFAKAVPLDIISPYKSPNGAFAVNLGVIVPYLYLERASYKFGLNQNASQTYSLRGDTQFIYGASPRSQEYPNTGISTYTFSNTAVPYTQNASTLYATSVMLRDSVTGAYRQLFFGEDYTNTSGGFTTLKANAGYDTICVTYFTNTQDSYPQAVHQGVSVKPAAIRSKDIDVFLAPQSATPVFTRLSGVQSVDINWSVSYQKDEEFGNNRAVGQDFDTPEVSGTIGVKPRDPADMWQKLAMIGNVNPANVLGPLATNSMMMEVRISNPDTGHIIKTLKVDDARFTIPSIQGRVDQRLEVSLPFDSDTGNLKVIAGTML